MSLTISKQKFVDAAVAVYGVGAVLNRKQILEVAENAKLSNPRWFRKDTYTSWYL